MNLLKIRSQLREGKTIFDLPLRVTFYARVSTDKEEQRSSLENQVQYYTELIMAQNNWTYIPGYVDEGISGTSTKRRDSFNRMIADAKAGCFDFIITKEISRFSRSTLDSIRYTQELLENDVGVLFQNDNINTLDADSEFRLVVMAGVAQDEVRKLSERLKFGFRQAIKNGRVLGNDSLWGYDKKDCTLTVNEEEAAVVRRIFELYANERLGIRRISQKLGEEGHTSREGNDFNVLTIRHILTNPKYKGWYCAKKSETLDYRTKRRVYFDESEWVMYPSESIPAIVSEELWDRANALYKRRSGDMTTHKCAADYHNKYPYSGKIFCKEHAVSFHREVLKSAKAEKEVWNCKIYRQRGRKWCSAPQVRTSEVNAAMARIFDEQCISKETIIDAAMKIITSAASERDFSKDIRRLENELAAINAKKDRLLELSVAGAITVDEFKKRNEGFNENNREICEKIAKLHSEEAESGRKSGALYSIKSALAELLSFKNGADSALAASILDRIALKGGESKNVIDLEIKLKNGAIYKVCYAREKTSFRFIRFLLCEPRAEDCAQ